MNPQSKIELSKSRDFSAIISDTFQFIKENFKQLVVCFFVFCGFFMLAAFITLFMHQLNMVSITNSINNDPNDYNSITNVSNVFARFFDIQFIIGAIFEMIYLIIMQIAIMSYMAIYKSKGNIQPTTAEVWAYIKYYFWRILGSSVVLGLLVVIACVFCLIPGIWLYPIVSLMFPIMIIENGSLSYAFNQAFRIIKGNWWMTFGVIFVSGIIAAMMAGIVALPVSAFTVGNILLHKSASGVTSPVLSFATIAISEVTRIFYIIPTVAIVLCYYSLNEAKEGTGLMERINQMGNNTNPTDLPTEEY